MMFRKITDINTEKIMNMTIKIQNDFDTEDQSINKIGEYPENKNVYIFTISLGLKCCVKSVRQIIYDQTPL